MKRSIATGWIAGLVLVLIAAPLQAQTTVQGSVVVHSGPVGHEGRRPARRVIVRHRELIVVERVQARRGWWKKHNYRVVTVYFDGHRYYRRPFRSGLRQVIVYKRGGRYYIDANRWKEHRHHDRDRDHDRAAWDR